MAYYDVSLLSADNDFLQRCSACGATEGMTDPWTWTVSHQWELAATPSFGDKYAYAIAMGIQNPGRDQSVISDAEILSAVQALAGVGTQQPA
jgi:hypothetical protein